MPSYIGVYIYVLPSYTLTDVHAVAWSKYM